MGQSTNNSPASTNILEKWFHLSEQGTTIKRELLAGLTTLFQWPTFCLSIPASWEWPA